MMRVTAALLVLAALSDAAAVVKRQVRPPITVSMVSESGNFSQIISEANDLVVSFHLTEPIICPAEDPRCRVVILLHNSRPDELVLSQCHVIWNHYDDYLEPRNVTISTVENFLDDGERTFHVGTQVNSSTELYRDFPLPDLTITTEPKNTVTCHSITDPNYRQWDGGNFVINTAGTFNLWSAPLRDWQVQSRVDSGGFNCGVAIRDGCDRYVVDRCSGTLVMRQYTDSTDNLAPRVTREQGDTYVFTSQRAGATVRVRERVRITRHGRSICGWSGCRVIYHTTRQDWLDITMTAPGRDWGFLDNTNTPRTNGVCGHYNGVSRAEGDALDCNGNGACSTFVANHRVQGTTLFDATPDQCVTPRITPDVDYNFCAMPPRPIQRPILQTHDIEDITELILRERPEDRSDDRIRYDFSAFEGQPFVVPERSEEFRRNATTFCTHALLTTTAAELCDRLNVDTTEFVNNCINDMMFQANASAFIPGADTDDRHDQLARAQLEEMQSSCISDAIRTRQHIQLTCDADAECEVTCIEQETGDCVNTCVGDCRIIFNNVDLEALANSECPNECGARAQINGTLPGQCVHNAEGNNVCACNEGFEGNDCSIVSADRPTTTKLFPFVCDIGGSECPANIAVEGEEFYHNENVSCLVVDGDETYETNATVISSTIIRCEMPEIEHSGAAVKTVLVSITLNGEVFSEGLRFMYRDERCRVCTRSGDCSGRVTGSCIIDNECHNNADPNPANPDCQVCDSAEHPLGWTFTYTQPQCGPTIRRIGTTVRIQENQGVNRAISHAGVLPFRLSPNPYTDDDTTATTVWTLSGADADRFTVANSGTLSLTQGVDFEVQQAFTFELTATKGGLSDTMTVNLEVVNIDEEATFEDPNPSATIAENTVSDSLLTIRANDPDGENTAFGAVTYSLRSMNIDGSALQHFAINPTTGVIRITNPLNFEDAERRHFRVAATTGAGSTITIAVEIIVTNVNEAPTAVRLTQEGSTSPAMTLTEDMTAGDVVGDLTVVDPDRNDRHDLTLVNSANGKFRINGQNQLVVATGGFDFEDLAGAANRFFTIVVRATDTDGEGFNQELLLTITDGNDAPHTIRLFKYSPATLSRTEVALESIPEDQPLGVVGVFTVEDQDVEQTHSFTIEGLTSTSPFYIVGNELRLVRPLNYEQQTAFTLNVYAIDNGEPEVLQSNTQTFILNVEDRPDLPGYFQFLPANGAGVSETTAVGTVIGTVSGLDQDPNQHFDIRLGNGEQTVTLGESACAQDALGYTNCTAQVTLAVALDFESNRVSATASVLLISVQADDSGSDSTGTGDLYLPILNGNDAPSGVLVQSLIPGAGPATVVSTVNVEEAQASLPVIAVLHAADDDDSCPLSLEGCQGFNPTGMYSFELVSQTATYTLSPDCAERRTAASRVAMGRVCSIILVDPSTSLVVGRAAETVQVRVSDQTGLSFTQSMEIAVIAPQVRLSLSFDSVDESVIQTTGTTNTEGSLGNLVVTGWTESTEPVVTLTGAAAQLFVLSESSSPARRDLARAMSWTVSVVEGAVLDFETTPEVTFSVAVASAGAFEGLAFDTTLAVADRDEPWRSMACQAGNAGDCAPATQQSLRLHDDAPAGTVVASLVFSDPDDSAASADPFWRIVRTSPTTGLFALDQVTGMLTTTDSADSLGLENGDYVIEVSVADTSAPIASPRSDRFSITVTIYDDCDGQLCSAEGSCRDQVNTYQCLCLAGWTGPDCQDLALEEIDQADTRISTEKDSDAGDTVALVLGVLFMLLLVVAVALFVRNKRHSDRMAMDGLGGSAMVSNPAHALYETIENDIIQGVTNPMYDWYKPGLSKQAAYQQLSVAAPGTFVVRDGISSLDNPMYCLHVKTPQALIKDVNINGSPGEVALVGGGVNAPAFASLPQLIDHYGNPTEQPFVLNPSILVAPVGGEDIYDNALITNRKVDLNQRALPRKMNLGPSY